MKLHHLPLLLALSSSTIINAGCTHKMHTEGIHAKSQQETMPQFDIVQAKISTKGNIVTFQMKVSSKAGEIKPSAIGQLAGSSVFSYVWPTSIDSYEVGFEKNSGILALAVTAHPDFDDTPLYDENTDGDTNNDGNVWHSHWVVLSPNAQCGKDALAVVDIPEGIKPRLPITWPGLPILLDSPGWDPVFNNETVEVNVPFEQIDIVEKASFDGVTAGLRVNQSVHAPLLCVVNVMDIASGDLSLPGKVNQ